MARERIPEHRLVGDRLRSRCSSAAIASVASSTTMERTPSASRRAR